MVATDVVAARFRASRGTGAVAHDGHLCVSAAATGDALYGGGVSVGTIRQGASDASAARGKPPSANTAATDRADSPFLELLDPHCQPLLSVLRSLTDYLILLSLTH